MPITVYCNTQKYNDTYKKSFSTIYLKLRSLIIQKAYTLEHGAWSIGACTHGADNQAHHLHAGKFKLRTQNHICQHVNK